MGDNLVPDYITHVQEGGVYGWPWWYIGDHQDPRLKGRHPELKDKAIVPDVLLQPHNASLEMAFYNGKQFPEEYQGDIFASQHGSWNRSVRVGYEVTRVPLHQTGKASGDYEDFLTGFVVDNRHVWGRPVGVAVAPDGSLLVSDDGSNSIWRVALRGEMKQVRKTKKPGTGDPLHTQEPVAVASFRTWRGWRGKRCAGPIPDSFHIIIQEFRFTPDNSVGAFVRGRTLALTYFLGRVLVGRFRLGRSIAGLRWLRY